MDFIDRLRALSASGHQRAPHAHTEEAAKHSLVLPFLNVFVADVGT